MLGGEGVGVEMGPRRVHGIGSFPEKKFSLQKIVSRFHISNHEWNFEKGIMGD